MCASSGFNQLHAKFALMGEISYHVFSVQSHTTTSVTLGKKPRPLQVNLLVLADLWLIWLFGVAVFKLHTLFQI